MLQWLICWSLNHRILVLLFFGLLGGYGVWCMNRLNTDAFPDTTPVQIQINTVATTMVPEEIERLITLPVELAMGGLPGLEEVRSISKAGLSQVIVTFVDGTDIYFARQQINERLGSVEVPSGVSRPEMGPVSTGLGEVFHYTVSYKNKNVSDKALMNLRTLHDWRIKPAMRSVPGTAEINSWGGYEKQYQVRIDPVQLVKYDLTFNQVVQAVQANNLNVGGGSLGEAGGVYLVLGRGRAANTHQIGEIVVAAKDGVPIYVRDVAAITIGHELRRGMVTANGEGEVVLGLGFMLMGKNSYQVTSDLKKRLDSVKSTLPEDVDVKVVYDRTELVDQVIDTVRRNLFEGATLVIALLFIFLGNLRAGLIVALAIPLSMLVGFIGMMHVGIAGTLLSLGAIDFGIIVDSSVVMIENIVHHLSHGHGEHQKLRLEAIRDAALEVRKPTMFGQLIIMIVYIPILTLEGVEGKMFRPMAWTVVFVLIGSLMVSLTLMPVLASLLLPKTMEDKDPFPVRLARRLYEPVLHVALSFKTIVLGGAAAVLVFGVILAGQFGSEFVPRLSEGAIVLGYLRPVGVSLDESRRINTLMERIIRDKLPDEVDYLWTRAGGPEVATDPSGIETADIFISLKPRSKWRPGVRTQNDVIALIEKEVADIPGQTIWFTQPIEQRINEMISGVRADVAVKIFADDLDDLVAKAREIEKAMSTIPGVADLAVEQLKGQPILEIKVKQDQLARYGLSAESVLVLVESLGSKSLGVVVEKDYRFPMAVRLPETYRTNTEAVRKIVVASPNGDLIPLARVADINLVDGASTINREWGKRRIVVMCNVRGTDMGSFVAEAQRRIAETVDLPPDRYRVEWGGQFENLQRASTRLTIVVPIALGMIGVLLFITYWNVIDTMCIFSSVPFAAVGGAVGLWMRDMPFSISAGIGFITLSGVSVLNSMIFVSAFRDALAQGRSVREAVVETALGKLRTVLMTSLVASIGFLPMAVGVGMGAEVQRPLATVVIAGVIGSTFMALFILPVMYTLLGWPATPMSVPDVGIMKHAE
jgi:cobalt-zinc-cadmium resistance protein CzcA